MEFEPQSNAKIVHIQFAENVHFDIPNHLQTCWRLHANPDFGAAQSFETRYKIKLKSTIPGL